MNNIPTYVKRMLKRASFAIEPSKFAKGGDPPYPLNLPVFPSLQNKFNDIFGTSEVIRMRHNNGWDLSREEVEWLLDHCED